MIQTTLKINIPTPSEQSLANDKSVVFETDGVRFCAPEIILEGLCKCVKLANSLCSTQKGNTKFIKESLGPERDSSDAVRLLGGPATLGQSLRKTIPLHNAWSTYPTARPDEGFTDD